MKPFVMLAIIAAIGPLTLANYTEQMASVNLASRFDNPEIDNSLLT